MELYHPRWSVGRCLLVALPDVHGPRTSQPRARPHAAFSNARLELVRARVTMGGLWCQQSLCKTLPRMAWRQMAPPACATGWSKWSITPALPCRAISSRTPSFHQPAHCSQSGGPDVIRVRSWDQANLRSATAEPFPVSNG